ncbi:arylamine N-acetyltransferase [Neobacillus rhizophilus]|uniref:Arylamine N-acetyltransferase n=1 Tax=Neobacillus rhizophilus TaxID=2833579 RepID=A0A942U1B8_9BACI|nr:arylamine N-acetyltransferase [Neobacillus rhizophilus]MBS4211073.1 arylamine N-acetyltransferase [Neobacillus rhizophilus]
MDQWTKKYLSILNVEAAAPNYEFLQRLVEAHLHRLPFEVCSKYYYFSTKKDNELIPSKEKFLDNFLERGFGGNCYILNIHFGELLQSLGFEAKFVRARGGNNHLALMVTIEGKSYYSDVGYMAPLFEPLLIEKEPYLIRCGEEIIIKKEKELEYLIDRRTGGKSFVVKTIEWVPVQLESFKEDIFHSHRDEGENPFMRRIVATIFKERVSYAVVNSKLIIKSDQHIQVQNFEDKDEWLNMMQSTFNLHKQDLEFALNFLKERNVLSFN